MTISREGFDIMLRKLAALESGAPRIVAAGIRKSMRVIQAGIAAVAPVGDTRKVRGETITGGGLGNSIGSRQKKSRGELVEAKTGIGVAKTQVGFGVRVSKGKSSVPYGHWAAAGTTARYTGARERKDRKGRIRVTLTGNKVMYRGIMPPNDFVESGYEATKSAAEAAGVAEIEQQIRKIESTG